MGKACSKCGDENPPEGFRKGRTICIVCFKEQRKAKDAAYRERKRALRPPTVTRICDVYGCDRKHSCRGFCNKHYKRFMTNGTTDDPVYGARKCSVDGCARAHKAYGMCNLHFQRSRKDELKVIRRRCYLKTIKESKARSKAYRDGLSEHERTIYNEKRRNYIASLPKEKKDHLLMLAAEKRESLDDSYILRFMREQFGVKNPPQELIELKRVQLKIHRELNRGATK